MTAFYQFASDSPWLTFFIAVLAIGLIGRFLKFIAILVRGYPPAKVKACKKDKDFRSIPEQQG